MTSSLAVASLASITVTSFCFQGDELPNWDLRPTYTGGPVTNSRSLSNLYRCHILQILLAVRKSLDSPECQEADLNRRHKDFQSSG